MPFEFTQDAYRDFSDQILKAEGDQATLTTVLADMQGTYVEQLALATKQAADMAKITEENERLKKANMELYLRVGEQAQAKAGPVKVETEDDKEMDVETYMKNYFKEGK